jgi:hypothetical protein
MRAYSLTHLSDRDLLRDLHAIVAQDRFTTAALLAHIAEVDARRLYLAAAHPSMYSYCVHELRLSEDAALKRIQAARTARQFPIIFAALTDGRLHLTGVGLLAPHLIPENVEDLLNMAAHKTKSEVELLLAQRFPRPEMLALVQPLPASPPPNRASLPAPVATHAPAGVGAVPDQHAPAQVEAAAPRSRMAPSAPQRFELHLTIGQDTYDRLQYAQALLSHAIAPGDVAEVFDRALQALIPKLERRKLGATGRPRLRPRHPTTTARSIPAHVRRAVRERDGGRCTFVSDAGRRCPARTLLEFDHIDPVARGGDATVDGLRIRCDRTISLRRNAPSGPRSCRTSARRHSAPRRSDAHRRKRRTAPTPPRPSEPRM